MFVMNQLAGFSAGGQQVLLTDEGQSADGGSGSTVNITSQSSNGPFTVVCVHWHHGSSTYTLSSLTFDGNAMTILVQATLSGGNNNGCAIAIIAGAFSSKTVALTFSGTVGSAGISVLSLSGLISATAEDTDSDTGASPALASLTAPSVGGIALVAHATNDQVAYTNATELVDKDFHSSNSGGVGYVPGTPAGNISVDEPGALVGVSLR